MFYERLAQLLPSMIKAEGITEQLRATDQMEWVDLMNTVKAQAKKVIFAELVYQEVIQRESKNIVYI